MEIQVLEDPAAVAAEAARVIAEEGRASVAARGRFCLAVSGGQTPWQMLRALAREDLAWGKGFVVQVNERVAPPGTPERNLTGLRDSLLAHVPLPPENVCPMSVDSPDLAAAARQYAIRLQEIAGAPPELDLKADGVLPDGHTASLVPGDPVLEVSDADVALTQLYRSEER